jgi:hypothetical protein
MNFDYRGTIVNKSTPTPELRTVKKVLHVDSADRDTGIYYTNGEFVVYLPRVYEKVVSLRLMSAEFPTLESGRIHSYIYGQNNRSATYSQDEQFVISENASPNYFLVEIEGLNKCDETAVGGNKSQFPDSFFAKIVTTGSTKAVGDDDRSKLFIEYNDHSGQENISKFSPPIGKLDRLRIRTRLHSQQGSQGFIYWTSDQAVATTTDEGTNTNIANYCLTFEIEYLDNGFDNFSSMSTSLRPSDRA